MPVCFRVAAVAGVAEAFKTRHFVWLGLWPHHMNMWRTPQQLGRRIEQLIVNLAATAGVSDIGGRLTGRKGRRLIPKGRFAESRLRAFGRSSTYVDDACEPGLCSGTNASTPAVRRDVLTHRVRVSCWPKSAETHVAATA